MTCLNGQGFPHDVDNGSSKEGRGLSVVAVRVSYHGVVTEIAYVRRLVGVQVLFVDPRGFRPYVRYFLPPI